jgi:two-component system, NtrC family, response regulator AtoC
MARPTILVVDDKGLSRSSLAECLKPEGYEVLEAETGQASLDRLAEGVDLVLLDGSLRDIEGLALLRRIRELDQDIPVILLTASASVETAVEAMKLGASHVASRPVSPDDVAPIVERALETTRLRRDVRRSRTLRPYTPLSRIVGTSPAIAAVRSLVARVALSPASTVLLTGESGTGKDLAANVIHYASARASGPSSASRVRRCPNTCSKVSCSATSVVRSRMPEPRNGGCWRRRMAARCCSMKSAR